MVVFAEIPDHITLAIDISNCPCHCPGCHSQELWQDVGTELTEKELVKLIEANKGIDCVCFMGGDAEPSEINKLAKVVKGLNILHNNDIKVGWYSGRSYLSDQIDVYNFDYIKIGPYIETFGPLTCTTTNQRLYHVETNGTLTDITEQLQLWKL